VAHEDLFRRKISVPQEGKTQLFRGVAELLGNAALTRAFADADALQASTFYTATDGVAFVIGSPAVVAVTMRSPSTNFATIPDGPVVAGDFLFVEGYDGYFVVASLLTFINPNDTIVIDATNILVNTAAPNGTVAGNVLTSAPFLAAGVLPGDRVDIFTGLNGGQTFTVVSVSLTSLIMDGAPEDDSLFFYRISRGPQLSEFIPRSATGLTFYVAKAPVNERGVPSRTRFPGFGDAALSTVINRAIQGVAANTQFLKTLLESRIAVATIFSGTGVPTTEINIASTVGDNGLWVGQPGQFSGGPPYSTNQLATIFSLTDPDGLDIEDGSGNNIFVNDVRNAAGGGGSSIVNQRFVSTDIYSSIYVRFSAPIPLGQDFVLKFGKGRSVTEIVVDEPDALLKGESSMTTIHDEEIPELVDARKSDRFGQYGSDLLAGIPDRLNGIDSRLSMWSWLDDPNFRFGFNGATLEIHHDATRIVYDGVTYTAAAGAITIGPVTGHVRAILTVAGSVLSFDTISQNFDPDALVGSIVFPTPSSGQIVVAIFNSAGSNRQLTTFNMDGKDSDVSLVNDPQFEIRQDGTDVKVSWRNNLDIRYKGLILHATSSAAVLLGEEGPFTFAAGKLKISSDNFFDSTDVLPAEITLAAAVAASVDTVAADINAKLAAAVAFPYNQIAMAFNFQGRLAMRSVFTRDPNTPALSSPHFSLLAPSGDDVRATLFGGGPYTADYQEVTVLDGEGLFLQITEDSDSPAAPSASLVALSLATTERRNDVILLASNDGGELTFRGDVVRFKDSILMRPSSRRLELETLEIRASGDPPIDTSAPNEDRPRVLDAHRGPDGIGIAWIAKGTGLTDRDIFFAKINESGKLLFGPTRVVDISDSGAYAGAPPVSADPTDISVTYAPLDDKFEIAWGDTATGIYRKILNGDGTSFALATRVYSTAGVKYVDITTLVGSSSITLLGWIDTADDVRTGRLGTGLALISDQDAIDIDSIEKAGVTIVALPSDNDELVKAHIYYGKETATAGTFGIQVAIADVGNVPSYEGVLSVKQAVTDSLLSPLRLDSLISPRGTVLLLLAEAATPLASLYELDASGVSLGLLSDNGDTLRTTNVSLTDATAYFRKNQAIVASFRTFPNFANAVFTVLSSDGAVAAMDSVLLGAFGWEEQYASSLSEIYNRPELLQTFLEATVGAKDGLILGDQKGVRIETQTIAKVLTGTIGSGTTIPFAVSFARPFASAPRVFLTGRAVVGTVSDQLIVWAVDESTLTAQGVTINATNPYGGAIAGAGQTIRASMLVIGT
jgi:hypothetical protein